MKFIFRIKYVWISVWIQKSNKYLVPIKRLFETIQNLYCANYNVVAVTSDMGTGNQKLWTKLNVRNNKNCFFFHPVKQDEKVFVFADVPHLLKLLRNHYVDQGFQISGKVINKSCVEELLESSSDDLKITHKITDYHLTLRSTERQKVRTAAQLFSNTVAKAIEWCGTQGLFKASSWKETIHRGRSVRISITP